MTKCSFPFTLKFEAKVVSLILHLLCAQRLIEPFVESQLKAAQWRASTYIALDQHAMKDTSKRDNAWATSFEEEFIHYLISRIFGKNTKFVVPQKVHDGLAAICAAAHAWNYKTKATFLPLDFQVVLFKSEELFDERTMRLYDSSKITEKEPRVIASTRLGLKSSISYGKAKPMEEVWQEKVVVVTEDFFA